MRPKIVFSNVSKGFNLYKKQSDKLKDIMSLKGNKNSFYALNNLSFKIYEGEAIGIVGLNGSGKSTLSNLLAQVIPPTSGSIEINGETSLIAISAGLNNQLTGLENIELKCLMHGLKKEEINRLQSEIIEFADIGRFIDQPVKNYSSGMRARLGFAISIHTKPDILIVDEALSVGDQTFYDKCLNKINEFKSQGKTIIFISHSISQIKAFCDRVMWIHFGTLKKFDETDEVILEYRRFIRWFNAQSEKDQKAYRTKMLESQYKEDARIEINQLGRQSLRARKNSVKKKSNSLFLIQCVVLFLAVIVSASFMFGINPVQGIGKYITNNESNDNAPSKGKPVKQVSQEVNAQEVTEVINLDGLINVGKSGLYSKKDLKNEIEEMSFSDEIYVLEKTGSTYKIRTADNTIGYMNAENITLVEDNSTVSQKQIIDFLPIFPERFTDAYSYFLTFLNTESGEVKSTLRGLTSEDVLVSGETTLSYSIYDAQYIFNHDNIAKSIAITNMDTNNEQWNTLKEEASLKSNDEQYYYFVTEQYKIVADLGNKKVTISLLN